MFLNWQKSLFVLYRQSNLIGEVTVFQNRVKNYLCGKRINMDVFIPIKEKITVVRNYIRNGDGIFVLRNDFIQVTVMSYQWYFLVCNLNVSSIRVE